MNFLFPFLVLPIVYLVALAVLALKRSPRGIGTSLVFFVVAFASGYWAITQSTSSTASLGFLWLPFMCASVGFLGLAFGRWARGAEDQDPRRILGWLGLAGAVVIIGITIREGIRTRGRNEARAARYQTQVADVIKARAVIAEGLKANSGRQREYMDSSIRARMNDRPFLIAALDYDSISPGILDTLAISDDQGIALEAVRNPSTLAATLTKVYEQKTYPDYFFQALAGNPNTPPEILRKLYSNPGVISSLDIWLAGNPRTPRDVLEQITRKTTDVSVISRLRENPAADCAMRAGTRAAC